MIYLLDDKISRQIDYGWTDEVASQWSEVVCMIPSFAQFQKKKEEILEGGCVVLLHESFYQSVGDGASEREFDEFVEAIESDNTIYVAEFSGSKNNRFLSPDGKYCCLHPSVLYSNIYSFLLIYSSEKRVDFKKLLFGENDAIEERLISDLKQVGSANSEANSAREVSTKKILFASTSDDWTIESPFSNSTNLFDWDFEKSGNGYMESSESVISSFVGKYLSQEKYDAIYIPMSFGNTLSDFLGLRLCMYIRFTSSPNQYTPIVIYGYFKYSDITSNVCFDAVKLRGVKLVRCDNVSMVTALSDLRDTCQKELLVDLEKVHLSVPKNYDDNHSISNEWALIRWVSAIGKESIEERAGIDSVFEKVEEQLYFRYLSTRYPVDCEDLFIDDEDELRIRIIKYAENGSYNKEYVTPDLGCKSQEENVSVISKPKILFIDDQAEKGWNEVFLSLLNDRNEHLWFECIGKEELGEKNQDEIVEYVVNRIIEEEFNIVLLDFRLLHSDNESETEQITGYKILHEVKKENPGVQVLIFSATNKIWNLQKMQAVGADGFVIKESPENSIDSTFTTDTIFSFLDQVGLAISNRFKCQFCSTCISIVDNLKTALAGSDKGSKYEIFLKNRINQCQMILDAASRMGVQYPYSLDIVFLNCYNFLESFAKHYVKYNSKDYRFVMGFENGDVHRLSVKKGNVSDSGEFVSNSQKDQPSWFQSISSLMIYYFQVAHMNSKEIQSLWEIKDSRNNEFIHSDNSKHFSPEELLTIVSLCELITRQMKE